MPMDGFTLAFMTRELKETLTGARVDRVNQPERDALLLLLRNQGKNVKLLLTANADQARVQLTEQNFENPAEPPMFCMLMRKHLQNARLAEIAQWKGDRVMTFTFECMGELGDVVRKTLFLELMGRYSNLTLVDEKGIIVDCIRHVSGEMSRVRLLVPGVTFEMPPAQDKLDPGALDAETLAARLSACTCSLEKALVLCISGIAGLSAKETCAQLGIDGQTPCGQLNATQTAEAIVYYYRTLPERFAPVTQTDATGLATDYFPFPYITFDTGLQKTHATLSEAMDAFYLGRDLRLRMRERGASLQRLMKNHVTRLEKKKAMMLNTLQDSEKAEKDRIFGELLTANIHRIDKGAEAVDVTDYYDPEQRTVRIPLSPQLSPAKNAQYYYKKYRKAKGAEQYAKEQLVTIEKELDLLENALEDLEKCVTTTDLAEIRELLAVNGYVHPEPGARRKKKPPEGKPYRFTAPDGTAIDVGKNALQNDRLTLHANAEETWMHAQGIPGSHIIVHTEKEPSPETLLYGAKLAAYFSKGRNHPSQPIDYTKRKYVKKASGSPAGLVTYTHFQTILVGLSPEETVTIGRKAAEN